MTFDPSPPPSIPPRWRLRTPRLHFVPRWLRRYAPPPLAGGLAVVGVITTVSLLAVTAWASGPARTAWLGTVQPSASPTVHPSPAPDPGPWQPPRPRAVPPTFAAPTGQVPTPPPPPVGGDPLPGDPLPGDPLPPVDFLGWAVLDRATGAVSGSDTIGATSTTASMIKVWLVADYLRLATEAEETPSKEKLRQFSLIIRDSNNEYTQTLFQEDLGGGTASIDRLIQICGLTDSYPVPGYWSNTQLSARDTARMGACLADGRAAGPKWTEWLLREMRLVRGIGDFGIRDAFPAGQRGDIAIKNGWVIRSAEGSWHVNCLAIGDTWVMGVLTRYPADLGYEQMGHLLGAEVCQTLAAQHLPGAG